MKWWFVVRGDKSDVKLLEKIGLGFTTNKLEIGTSFPILDSPHPQLAPPLHAVTFTSHGGLNTLVIFLSL